MTYATEIQKDGISSVFFLSVSPKYLTNPLDWETVVSGQVFRYYFPFGDITALTINGVARSIVYVGSIADVSLATDNVYLDRSTGYFYFKSATTLYDKTTIVTYQIRLATKDLNWYKDVLNSSSEQIHWRGLLRNVPDVQSSVSDIAYGIMPSYSATLSISNVDGSMFPNAHQVSFNNAQVDVYHCAGDLSIANTKLILRGVANAFAIDDGEMSISFIDQSHKLNNDFVTIKWASSTNDRYNTTDHPNLDPSKSGASVRDVLGFTDGIVPINVDYDAVGSIYTNRKYITHNHQTTRTSITTASTPAHGPSTIYFSSPPNTLGLNIGDSFQINTSAGLKSGIIDSMNSSSAPYYISCVDLLGTPVSGTGFYINDVSVVTVIKAGIIYTLKYGLHYTGYTAAQNHCGFIIVNNVEALLSIPSPITPFDMITARVYGGRPSATTMIGAHTVPSSYVTANSYGTITNGVILLYYALRQLEYDATGGNPDSVIDTQSFIDLYPSKNNPCGVILPERSGAEFLSYKEFFAALAQTLLIKLYIDDDGKWSVSQFSPLGTTTTTANSTQIIKGSARHDYDYNDILSTAVVKYSGLELSSLGQSQFNLTTSYSTNNPGWLHGIIKSKTFSSYFLELVGAAELARRLAFIFSERINKTQIDLPLEFFEKNLLDVVEISRTGLPGFDVDDNTDRTRKYSMTATKRTINKISFELTDQKGIEDNSGSW